MLVAFPCAVTATAAAVITMRSLHNIFCFLVEMAVVEEGVRWTFEFGAVFIE